MLLCTGTWRCSWARDWSGDDEVDDDDEYIHKTSAATNMITKEHEDECVLYDGDVI